MNSKGFTEKFFTPLPMTRGGRTLIYTFPQNRTKYIMTAFFVHHRYSIWCNDFSNVLTKYYLETVNLDTLKNNMVLRMIEIQNSGSRDRLSLLPCYLANDIVI